MAARALGLRVSARADLPQVKHLEKLVDEALIGENGSNTRVLQNLQKRAGFPIDPDRFVDQAEAVAVIGIVLPVKDAEGLDGFAVFVCHP